MTGNGYFDISVGLIKVGAILMSIMISFWNEAARIAMSYLTINPANTNVSGLSTAWSYVSEGTVWSVANTIAVAAMILFFCIGWLKQAIDIHMEMTIENVFRIFARVALTLAIVTNCMAIATSILSISTAATTRLGANYQDLVIEDKNANKEFGVFQEIYEDALKEYQEKIENEDITITVEAQGPDDLSPETEEDKAFQSILLTGFICCIGGAIGGLTILVCGIELIMTVMSRFFRIFICIPLAPTAFASFAGGETFNQTGKTWIKNFIAYNAEAIVIALAVTLAFRMFSSMSVAASGNIDDLYIETVLHIVEMVIPMVTALGCARGADRILQRALGI